MAEFLTTTGVSHHLERIIKNTKVQLLLICPFLNFNQRVRDELEDQDKLKRDIRVVYGKRELDLKESEWLANTRIRTSFREHLHAKCYMNESQALITSMNLYEFSQQNNDEMGILVSAEEDPKLYRDIKNEAERIIRMSKEVEIRVTPVEDSDNDITRGKKDAPVRSKPQREPAGNGRQASLPEFGFCLRCGAEIPCVLDRPYCNSHYRSWAKYKNESFEEKHCHVCGTEHSTSMAKPLCITCFRKYRSALGAAS